MWAKGRVTEASSHPGRRMRYPKLQLWSIEELLEGTLPTLPDMADPYTGKRDSVRQAELFE